MWCLGVWVERVCGMQMRARATPPADASGEVCVSWTGDTGADLSVARSDERIGRGRGAAMRPRERGSSRGHTVRQRLRQASTGMVSIAIVRVSAAMVSIAITSAAACDSTANRLPRLLLTQVVSACAGTVHRE